MTVSSCSKFPGWVIRSPSYLTSCKSRGPKTRWWWGIGIDGICSFTKGASFQSRIDVFLVPTNWRMKDDERSCCILLQASAANLLHLARTWHCSPPSPCLHLFILPSFFPLSSEISNVTFPPPTLLRRSMKSLSPASPSFPLFFSRLYGYFCVCEPSSEPHQWVRVAQKRIPVFSVFWSGASVVGPAED